MSEKILRHIVIVPDGNGRWAIQRRLPRIAGHQVGVQAVKRTIKWCVKKNIEVLSLFAFSSENWQRPLHEVGFLMKLFLKVLQEEANKLHAQNIKLHFIGDRSRFDKRLQEVINKVERLTAENTGLKLVIAANYGGRWDICEALRKI